jgi:hypothetical protein
MSHEEGAWIRLAPTPDASSIACTNAGVFVGEVPLVRRRCYPCNKGEWRPRSLCDLNAELSDRFGLPVDFAQKMQGLAVVARALSAGNLPRAQVATLNLQIPDPPDLSKNEPSDEETIDLAVRLLASRLLKADWDPQQHPRWPAGSPDSIGGQFSPSDSGTANDDAALIPAQITIPLDPVFPEALFPRPNIPAIPKIPQLGPLPSEVMPPPIAIPNTFPRKMPTNPYPDRPECEEQWAVATKYCLERLRQGLMGGSARGIGRSVDECIRGQVTEDCGGNPIEYYIA